MVDCLFSCNDLIVLVEACLCKHLKSNSRKCVSLCKQYVQVSLFDHAARISELESHLSSMREELGGLQDNLDTEVSRAGRQARAEADRELQHSQSKMAALRHENEKHQAEVGRQERFYHLGNE